MIALIFLLNHRFQTLFFKLLNEIHVLILFHNNGALSPISIDSEKKVLDIDNCLLRYISH